MAYSVEFREAVAYSLSCVHLQCFTLKAKQEEALLHLYRGRDVFAWFPTGYGKSNCYQLLQDLDSVAAMVDYMFSTIPLLNFLYTRYVFLNGVL